MKILRAVLFLPAALLLNAQGPSSSVTIKTAPAGAEFIVDGAAYRSAATFNWVTGSKHTLGFPLQYGLDYQLGLDPGVKYRFSGWIDSSGQMNTGRDVTVTANPAIASFTAQVEKTLAVQLEFSDVRTLQVGQSPVCAFPGPALPVDSVSGVVRLNGACYWANTTVWVSEGPVQLEAYPYPGFVFAGWGLNTTSAEPFVTSVNVTSPIILRARFLPGKRVRFKTEPLGRDVMIDRQIVHTPPEFPCPADLTLAPVVAPRGGSPLCLGEFDMVPGSRHIFTAPSPQRDGEGRDWVFKAWAGSTSKILDYTTGVANEAETFTATFVRGVSASFVTIPAGVKLNIDGRDNWSSTNFIWGVGEKHTVTAPAQARDAKGRAYKFSGWANAGDATQEIIVTEDAVGTGIRYVASYGILNRVVVQSTIPGVTMNVDGRNCASPCTVDGEAGQVVRIKVPAVVSVSDLTRYEFQGPATEWTVTLDRDYQAVGVNYRTSNRLLAVVDPGDGAEIVCDPESRDGFYPADAQVAMTINPKQGFKFRRWEGDIEGTATTGWVRMDSPRIVRAMVDKVPFIPPAGIRNAAGETPETGVAAGSLISIYGQNLAKAYEAGPTSPLAQSLGGVVVRVQDRFLPLVFVSPEQINALLPSDLPEGEYQLVVQALGQADITGTFTVVRNAPGLFTANIEATSVAVALHEDGTQVTPASPAKAGEQVRLMGTGIGPYDRRAIDGFAAPAQPVISLVDTAEVVAGDLRMPAVWAGAAPGLTGVTAVRFRIPAELGSGARELRVSVNGKQSNPVLLPLE